MVRLPLAVLMAAQVFAWSGIFSNKSADQSSANKTLVGLIDSLLNQTHPHQMPSSLPHLSVIRALYRTNCASSFRASIQNSSNKTIFLPVDEAFGSLAGLIGGGALRLDCQGNFSQNPFVDLGNGTNNIVRSIMECLPDLMMYHIIPQETVMFNTSNLTMIGSFTGRASRDFLNVSVLETALNSSVFVNFNTTGKSNATGSVLDDASQEGMDQEYTTQGQYLVANSTNNATFLNYGFSNPARVISAPLNASDGVAYFIDQFLIPPLPLNATLNLANQTYFLNNSLASSADQANNFTNVTILVPLDSVFNSTENEGGNENINAANYILPMIIYANETNANQTFTAMSNNILSLNLTSNFSVSFNDVPVAVPNVPFSGGVLHFLNSTLSVSSSSSSSVSSSTSTSSSSSASSSSPAATSLASAS